MKTSDVDFTKRDPNPGNRKNLKLVIGILSLALFAMSLFFILEKSKNTSAAEVSFQKEGNQLMADLAPGEENELRKSFDETLIRLDSLTAVNDNLKAELAERNQEIAEKKAEIRRILNNSNVSKAELQKAKELIASLNETISSLEQEVAVLTQDKETLIREKEVLQQENVKLNEDLTEKTKQNEELTVKVDIGSTLHASNIMITPVKIKKNDKEKVTYTAKRVDKFMISFDVSNRIIDPGMKDIYITVMGPDGKMITGEKLGSGTFVTREEGNKTYTTKVPVELETTKKKLVEFSFEPDNEFQQGNYHIQVYQNGYLIGQGTSELKKGGLFG